ncbi:hypothetical protein OHV05_32640 [Kitasatospora sp. NBC_00070]|uniref:hypothetical protein n=1 Tax=Kitasatospora sp. NBC_00070 TaxID=2975962 RepID=UPI00324F6291
MLRSALVRGGWLGVVMAVGMVGCGGGGSTAAPPPVPTVERTDGPGPYQPPRGLCGQLDFTELATAVATLAGPPEGGETGANPAEASGSECKQSLSGGDVHGRVVVQCSAWKDTATAIRMHDHSRTTAVDVAGGTLTEVPGLGSQAFRLVSSEEGPWKSDLHLVVRDGNLDCELKTQTGKPMDALGKDLAFAAMAATVKAVLPKLRVPLRPSPSVS